MQIVDIYCRSATYDSETYEKLRRQELACRAYCTEHGLSIGMIHYEVAGGHTYRDRELLQLLRNRYRESIIHGVVVTTIDRLSRSQTHLAILIEEMESYNTTLHCVNEHLEDSVMGKIVRLILNYMAEIEREK